MRATVTLGKQGRLVIPADVRAALGLEPGDELSLSVSDMAIHLMRPEDAVQALWGYAKRDDGRSLVDELIAERRAAAAAGD